MIFFDEPSHTYRLDDPVNGELCISATTFLGLFKKPFRGEYWSWYTALRLALNMEKSEFSQELRIKFRHNWDAVDDQSDEEAKDIITSYALSYAITLDEMRMYQQIALHSWKKENDDSKTKGTNFHNYKEGEIYRNNGLEYDGVYTKIVNQVADLSKLHDPNSVVIAPELQMYNREFKVSGTADKIFIYPNKDVDIDDWKTNKKIEMENKYKGKGKNKLKGKMFYPLQHLDDVNYNHYCLQVSLYAWMLEQYGYKPRTLKFTHVVLDDVDKTKIVESTEYRTHYMKHEVENMLNYYAKNKEELHKRLKK